MNPTVTVYDYVPLAIPFTTMLLGILLPVRRINFQHCQSSLHWQASSLSASSYKLQFRFFGLAYIWALKNCHDPDIAAYHAITGLSAIGLR
jgi:hypothetical protein